MTTRDADPTLTTGDVATTLGVSHDTVYRLTSEQLPFTLTPGGHRRYRYSAVRAFARERMHLDLPADYQLRG